MEGTADIDGHNTIKLTIVFGARGCGDSRIIYEDVNPAATVDHFRHIVSNCLPVCDVSNHAEHLAAGCAHLLDGSINGFGPCAVDGDTSALLRKEIDDRSANSPATPRYHNDLVLEPHSLPSRSRRKLPVPTEFYWPCIPRLA